MTKKIYLTTICIILLTFNSFAKGKLTEFRELLIKHEILHIDIVLKQVLLETNSFKSKACRIRNNYFGLYNGKRFYSSAEECIKAYKNKVQYKLRFGENYYKFLTRIKYASDKKYISKLKKINIVNKLKNDETISRHTQSH